MSAKVIVVIILQYIHLSNHYAVYLNNKMKKKEYTVI